MNESAVSVRYAKSLFQTAVEQTQIDSVYSDMETVFTVCNENADFSGMLENPVLKPSEKRQILNELFSKTFNKLTLSFFDLAVTNKREAYLKGISRNFLAMYSEYKGIKKATLTTTTKLDALTLQSIQDLLVKNYQSKVELLEIIDESLIGGFVLRVDDKQVDTSVSTHLKQLKRELMETIL